MHLKFKHFLEKVIIIRPIDLQKINIVTHHYWPKYQDIMVIYFIQKIIIRELLNNIL